MRITKHPKTRHANVNVHLGAGQPTARLPEKTPFLPKTAGTASTLPAAVTEITPGRRRQCEQGFTWMHGELQLESESKTKPREQKRVRIR